VALTTPPPADPSTIVVLSSSWMRPSSCIICCWRRCRLPMVMASLSVGVSGPRRPESAARGGPSSASADFADIHELVGEDLARLRQQIDGIRVGRGRLEVRRDAANDHRSPKIVPDAFL